MKHILSVLTENRPGVLARVSGMFARRGFNIDSLAVAATEDKELSRMTIVVSAENKPLEQITKQLHKLINVIRITELGGPDAIERELMLIKLAIEADQRAEVAALAEVFRANIVDVAQDTVTIEVTGTSDKLSAFESLAKPYSITELARTGKIALSRGTKEEE